MTIKNMRRGDGHTIGLCVCVLDCFGIGCKECRQTVINLITLTYTTLVRTRMNIQKTRRERVTMRRKMMSICVWLFYFVFFIEWRSTSNELAFVFFLFFPYFRYCLFFLFKRDVGIGIRKKGIELIQ